MTRKHFQATKHGTMLTTTKALGLMALVSCFVSAASCQRLSVIPEPLETTSVPGTLRVDNGAVIAFPVGDKAAAFDAEHLRNLLAATHHLQLIAHPTRSASLASVVLVRAQSTLPTNDESYDLDISPTQVTIAAASDAGLYYGTVTLWQIITANTSQGSTTLSCIHIHDAPSLHWRGIMLDSARHMQSIEYIRQLIDWMSLEKLNVLHWHLTDDQGWRLEIKRYPRLTQIGAWRDIPSVTQNGPSPERHYGGYYTQAQVRELVAYAAARSVMIVPEIEMPGHATTPIAAYPQFGSSSNPPNAPASDYGIFPNLYAPSEKTFTFLENVLTEVMELFPSPYIHVGGDEAIKDQWQASPAIQAQIKARGLKNEDALQSYFIKRIDTFLSTHGRRTLGWDEILQGGLAQNAAVMSWHGVQGGIDAAKQGHDAVLTPVRPLYFNYRQSDAAGDAPGRFALNTLQSVYAFDPLPGSLTTDQRRHILGIQANLWTEYVLTPQTANWLLFPRAAALAEVAWSTPGRRDWNNFLVRLNDEMRRYEALGINYDPFAFRVRSTETLSTDRQEVVISLANQTGFGTIRYTTDGSPATVSSPAYASSFSVNLPVDLHAAAFSEGDQVSGSAFDRHIDAVSATLRHSQDLRLCENDPAIAMEPDPPHVGNPVVLTNYTNPCWIYRKADLTGIQSISVSMVPLAYVFHDRKGPPSPGKPITPYGELEVHFDSCDGKLVTTIPFPPTDNRPSFLLRSDKLTIVGVHDLCFKTARPTLTPLWNIDWISLDQ